MKHFIFAAAEIHPDYKSKAIMEFTGASFSHIGILIETEPGKGEIYHATGEGVHETDADEFLKTHIFVHKIDISDSILDSQLALGWCWGSIGKDYSETELALMVIERFCKFLKAFAPARVIEWLMSMATYWLGDGKREMVCSEYGAQHLNDCTTIPIFKKIDCDSLDPVELIDALVEWNKLKQEEK